MATHLVSTYSETFRASRLLRAIAIPVALLMWIYSIAPPRDGDVMRYHLAHIRQIITDGRWETIADYHYALPFGWTLNYLPFERLHVPEAASLVNVALWLIIVGGLLSFARSSRAPAVAGLAAVAFFIHPFVVRTFASAMIDAYAIFIVYAIVLMLVRLEEMKGGRAVLFGFVCWIGAQSRYQLLALGVAATCIVVFHAARRASWRTIGEFSVGALGALVLSSPFYIANLEGFGNPFWPLLAPAINGVASYADQVADAFTVRMTGWYQGGYIVARIGELVSTRSLFPLALGLVITIPLSMRTRDVRYRPVAALGVLFLALWVIMEPRLFPRYVLLLLPAGALLFVPAFDWLWSRPRAARVVRGALSAAIVVMVALSALFSWDYVRYAATGDENRYHRYTWYYPVYDWINRNTPHDSRFLVIAYSGHSYYLDRPYRRADPMLSAVVDWSRVSSTRDLLSVLEHGRYQYVVFDDRDWRPWPAGEKMSSVIRSAIASHALIPVHASRQRLYYSRVMREYSESDVYVLRVAPPATTASRPLSETTSAPAGKNASLKR
jgi:hypothetical protein